MTKRETASLIGLTLFTVAWISASPARADLLSRDDCEFGPGALTLDTETGLQWLDVDLSTNRSWAELTDFFAGTNPDPELAQFAGLRFATEAEYLGLIGAIGVEVQAPPSEDAYSPMLALQSLVGVTRDRFLNGPQGSGLQQRLRFTIGWFDTGQRLGQLRTVDGMKWEPPFVDGSAIVLALGGTSPHTGHANLGHFLIREGACQEVVIPPCTDPGTGPSCPVLPPGVAIQCGALGADCEPWEFVEEVGVCPQGFFILPGICPGCCRISGNGAGAIGTAQPMYFDPLIAIGYEFEVLATDPYFTSVVAPVYEADRSYELEIWDGFEFVPEGTIIGGIQHSFGVDELRRFRIMGIDVAVGLEPEDPEAFAAGLTFSEAGTVHLAMTPLIVETNQPPTAVCQDVTVPADAGCQADVATAAVDAGSTDPENDPLSFELEPAAPYALGSTSVTLTVEDDSGAVDQCEATITVEDLAVPAVSCNSPGAISPPEAPVSITSTATDNCSAPAVAIEGYDCFAYNANGKRVDRTDSCVVDLDGDTVMIVDSSGIGTVIEWSVRATDADANSIGMTCRVDVIHPVP